MARAGASIADIQDELGHESDKIARHNAGEARKFAAANLMTKYSLAGLGQPVQVDQPAAFALKGLPQKSDGSPQSRGAAGRSRNGSISSSDPPRPGFELGTYR
jgi:hypothetical protein